VIGVLFISLLLLVLNGFFVAHEFGLVGSRQAKLDPHAEAGSRRARTAVEAMGNLNVQLAGAQLGITMASLGIGYVSEPALSGWFEGLVEGRIDVSPAVLHTVPFILALSIVVFLHMVIGEMVPKNATLADPERTLMWTAVPFRAYLTVFGPLVWVLNGLSNLGIRLCGVEPRDQITSAHTAEELVVMLAESHEEGLIEEFAHSLMSGVLDFGGRDAASVMVPREKIVAVSRSATVAEVERAVVTSGHSRMPMVDPDLDAMLGFVHSKDLLGLPVAAQDQPVPLRLVRRMLVVPLDRSLEDLLLSMRKARVHFAIVMGDDRRTAGLVTLEDLLEELVGDILDESDVGPGAPIPAGALGAGPSDSRPRRTRDASSVDASHESGS
jgi:CBS domain containing-hemolysin-like protein